MRGLPPDPIAISQPGSADELVRDLVRIIGGKALDLEVGYDWPFAGEPPPDTEVSWYARFTRRTDGEVVTVRHCTKTSMRGIFRVLYLACEALGVEVSHIDPHTGESYAPFPEEP